ncbi:MAG: DUF5115 domain-containing protein, partial [Mediterranea sp.]|nr:DUF5115 domain-containing protein [Mediterranea sp.]
MKKQFIYMGAWLLATTFAACNEDYTDWASPQSNPQEEATAEVTATFEAGKDAAIVVDNLTSDSVEIAQITNLVAKEGSTLRVSKLTINGDHSIPYTLVGNVVKVHAADLDSLTETTYQSRRSVPRALTLTMDAAAVSPDGEAFRLTGSDVNITLTPPTLPGIDPSGYYLIGSFNDWKSNNLLSFTQDATDPTLYTLETSFSTA